MSIMILLPLVRGLQNIVSFMFAFCFSHIAAIDTKDWRIWVSAFHTVRVNQTTNFHKGGVFAYERKGPYTSCWCPVDTQKYS